MVTGVKKETRTHKEQEKGEAGIEGWLLETEWIAWVAHL